MASCFPSSDVHSITRKIIESMMIRKDCPCIFLPPTNCKLVMMAKCISGSYLPSMNQEIMIDSTGYTHNLQRQELFTYNKNNNRVYTFNEVATVYSIRLSKVQYDECRQLHIRMILTPLLLHWVHLILSTSLHFKKRCKTILGFSTLFFMCARNSQSSQIGRCL